MLKKNKNALIVIDVQNDFCPGGNLAVNEGDQVVPVINSMSSKFYKVIATQDWHPANHLSFAKNHPGKKVYEVVDLKGISQVLWPEHCVQGTEGAQFHPQLNTDCFHLILRKGTNPEIDSYSAFMENDKKTPTGLEAYLKGLGIEQIFLCGLATDYCVFYSAMDAISLKFETYVIIDACKGVDFPEGNIEKALNTMKEKGIKIINSSEL